MIDRLRFRQMTRQEVDHLVDWAAREGWNPGLHDAEAFWATDPDAYIAADLDDELIGGGAITSYAGEFGFMGFFIVRPEFRGQGLGNALWNTRLKKLRARLLPGAGIGLDGVFEMQDYYAEGGFVFSHRNIRYRAEISGNASLSESNSDQIVPICSVPFDQLAEYDRTCFPAPRAAFLKAWITQPDALALGCLRQGKLSGFGIIRRCLDGCKIGPLFADDLSAALNIYAHLADFASGGPLFLDVPENNSCALDLAREHRMVEVFGCARMYSGPAPDIAHHRVFGVTTFELG